MQITCVASANFRLFRVMNSINPKSKSSIVTTDLPYVTIDTFFDKVVKINFRYHLMVVIRGFRFQPYSARSANFVLNNQQNLKVDILNLFLLTRFK